jgi:ankyrin repeat protein
LKRKEKRKIDSMEKYFNKSLSALYKEDMKGFQISMLEFDDLNFIDDEGRSLIFYAVLEGQFNAVKLLIEKNINLNIRDANGWTPLHYAVSEHYLEISNLLIEKGVEVNSKDNFGNTIIWRAVFTSKGRGEIIESLLNHGANPLIKNDSDISALELAKTIGNYDVKQFLL